MTAEVEPVKLYSIEKPRPLGSLIAAATRLTTQRINGKQPKVRKSETQQHDWQEDAWEMFDLVGEEHFLASTLAGRLAQARLYVGRISVEDPSSDPEAVVDPKINAILQSFGGSQAGRSQLLRRLAINLFVAGDGWLVGLPDEFVELDESGSYTPYPLRSPEAPPVEGIAIDELDWRMLSVSEINSTNGDTVTLQVGPDGDEQEFSPDSIYLIRVWRPHPKKWWEADSPTRASLPILKELVGLTMHVSAQVDSRLAGAGVLLVPSSAQAALRQAAGITGESNDDMFTDALIEAMLTPISDRSAAAALVPLVATVPDESVANFKYMSFATPLDEEARNLRDEAIRRLALGQDAPPELLLGTAGMNHWGAWLTQEETVTTHIEPPLALICDALTTQYLWPVLEQMGVENPEAYVIWYDVGHMVTRPNLGQDALVLHDRKVLSDDALRRTMGFDDSDAPERADDKAQVSEIVLRMVEANPALISRPGLGVLIEQLTAVVKGEVPPVYDPAAARKAAIDAGETPPQPVEGTEETPPEGAAANGVQIHQVPAGGPSGAPTDTESNPGVQLPDAVAPVRIRP